MEFTGLHQETTLLSIGLITDTGETFYAELTDYDVAQLNAWLEYEVMPYLKLHEQIDGVHGIVSDTKEAFVMVGDMEMLKKHLTEWLEVLGPVEIWSDCLAYDWVLFCEIFGGAFDVPSNVYYIPMDICTMFHMKGIDPDISREKFVAEELTASGLEIKKHHALFDAMVIKMCHDKMTQED